MVNPKRHSRLNGPAVRDDIAVCIKKMLTIQLAHMVPTQEAEVDQVQGGVILEVVCSAAVVA